MRAFTSKMVVVVTILFVSVILLYSAIWFYKAYRIKSVSQDALAYLSTALGSKDVQFFYSHSTVVGFPFDISVRISGLKFTTREGEDFVDISAVDDFIVEANTLLDSFKLTFPKTLNIEINRDGSDARGISLRFNEPAILNVDTKFLSTHKIIFNKEQPTDIASLISMIAEVNYKDSGYQLVDVYEGELMAKSAANQISLVNKENKHIDAILSSEGSQSYDLNNTSDKKLKIGNINLNLKASLNDIEDITNIADSKYKVNIEELSFESELFTVLANGSVGVSNEYIFPKGFLRVTLKNYENFANYIMTAYNNVLSSSTSSRNKGGRYLAEFLSEIASEKESDDKDIYITLKREENSNLFIGDYTLSKAIKIFKRSFRR